ncbi:hypothetical protein JTE90_004743, partial [Oedothorax gibbosus]
LPPIDLDSLPIPPPISPGLKISTSSLVRSSRPCSNMPNPELA